MRQHNSQRKYFTAFSKFLFQIAGMIFAAIVLSACSVISGKTTPDLTSDVNEERDWSHSAKAAESETEIARLKAENARLKTRVMELQRLSEAQERSTELRGSELGEDTTSDIAVQALAAAANEVLSTPSPIKLTQPPVVPPVAPAVVRNAANEALTNANVPVQPAPRLVQSSFASAVEEIDRDTVIESPLEMSSVLYGVHLASYRIIASAHLGWAKLQRENPEELGPLDVRIKRVNLPDKGVFLRMIAGGLSSEQKASALCERLKERGVFCSVVDFEGENLLPKNTD